MAATGRKGTILVTGANASLRSAIAEQIASKPELSAHHGVYTVRNAAAAPDLASALARPRARHPLSLDLTSLEDVRRVAGDINARISAGETPPIRTLVLAAGFQDFGRQSWTDDGLDTTFASNYLGHWLLTMLLLRSMDKETGRVVVVGSQSHDTKDPRNACTGVFAEERYTTLVPSDAAGFDAVARGTWSPAAEDPSYRSGLQRPAPWLIRVLLFRVVYPSRPLLEARRRAGAVAGAVDGEDGRQEGSYFDGREPLETSAESMDMTKRELVWRETVRYTGLKEGDTILADWR